MKQGKIKRFKKHVIHAIYSFKQELDNHCANGDTAQHLSAQFGISRNVLQQGFKHIYGIGIRDYKLKQRMERARFLLEAGKDVKEVALTLHYTKARAFSTAFKNYYGVTPTEFANSLNA
ncbi:helix-turn-helix transcriptional regulator [Niastella caeni]|nr:AraC family transcriptional regulator [Niastella caeni]